MACGKPLIPGNPEGEPEYDIDNGGDVLEDYHLFDANCTVGRPRMTRPPLRLILSARELLDEMDFHGIEEALIAHAGASIRMNYMADVNRKLKRWIAQGDGRLHTCWVWPITLRATVPDIGGSIQAMLESGAKALRLLPDRISSDLTDEWVCGRLLSALEARRIPVFLERTDLSGSAGAEFGVDHPRRGFPVCAIYRICQNHPHLPVVIMCSAGSPDLIVPLLESCPNLYLDFHCLPDHNHFEWYLRVGGARRLLYGSGLPRINPGNAKAMTSYSSANEQQKRLIFGNNLRRLIAEVR